MTNDGKPRQVGARGHGAGPGAALASVVLLGLILRLCALTQECIWFDEQCTYQTAIEPTVARVVANANSQANQPPYFVLLHAFMKLAGTSDGALRLPSALAGAWTPLMAWWLARALFPRRRWLGVGSAALVAVSPMSIWYSQEARPYAFEVALETTALALLADGTRRSACRSEGRRLSGFELTCAALTACAAVATHHFAIFPWAACLATLGAFAFLNRLAPRHWVAPVVILIAGGLYVAGGIASRLRTRVFLSFIPDHYGQELWRAALNAQLIGPHWLPLPAWGMLAAIVAGSVLMGWGLVALAARARRDPLPALILGLGFGASFVAPILISFIRGIDYYGQRYMIVALPFVTQLLALGAAGWGRRRRWGGLAARFALLAIVLGAQGSYLGIYYRYIQKNRWDVAARRIVQTSARDAQVVVVPAHAAATLGHYLPQGWPSGGIAGADAVEDLRRLFQGTRRPGVVVSYRDLRPWLEQAGVQKLKPSNVDLIETYPPGQELWVMHVPAAPHN